MKFIKKYNEDIDYSGHYNQDITQEDKEYFDIVLADFVDMGAKSSIVGNKIHYTHPETGSGSTREQLRYKIDIDLDSEYSNNNKKVGGFYPVSSTNGNIKQLIDYTKQMLEYTMELESCLEKIKIEYPSIYSRIMIDDSISSNRVGLSNRVKLSPFKISLFIYHL